MAHKEQTKSLDVTSREISQRDTFRFGPSIRPAAQPLRTDTGATSVSQASKLSQALGLSLTLVGQATQIREQVTNDPDLLAEVATDFERTGERPKAAEGLARFNPFNDSDARIQAFDRLQAQKDFTENYVARVDELVAGSERKHPQEFAQELQELKDRFIDVPASDDYLSQIASQINRHNNKLMGNRRAAFLSENRQIVVEASLPALGRIVTESFDTALGTDFESLSNIQARAELNDSIDMTPAVAEIRARMTALQDTMVLQNVPRTVSTPAFINHIVALATEARLPELLDVFDEPDKDGHVVSEGQYGAHLSKARRSIEKLADKIDDDRAEAAMKIRIDGQSNAVERISNDYYQTKLDEQNAIATAIANNLPVEQVAVEFVPKYRELQQAFVNLTRAELDNAGNLTQHAVIFNPAIQSAMFNRLYSARQTVATGANLTDPLSDRAAVRAIQRGEMTWGRMTTEFTNVTPEIENLFRTFQTNEQNAATKTNNNLINVSLKRLEKDATVGLSIADRVLMQSGIIPPKVAAFRELDEWTHDRFIDLNGKLPDFKDFQEKKKEVLDNLNKKNKADADLGRNIGEDENLTRAFQEIKTSPESKKLIDTGSWGALNRGEKEDLMNALLSQPDRNSRNLFLKATYGHLSVKDQDKMLADINRWERQLAAAPRLPESSLGVLAQQAGMTRDMLVDSLSELGNPEPDLHKLFTPFLRMLSITPGVAPLLGETGEISTDPKVKALLDQLSAAVIEFNRGRITTESLIEVGAEAAQLVKTEAGVLIEEEVTPAVEAIKGVGGTAVGVITPEIQEAKKTAETLKRAAEKALEDLKETGQ